MSENSNSNDKESDTEVSDFLSSEDSYDEYLLQKQPTKRVLQNGDNVLDIPHMIFNNYFCKKNLIIYVPVGSK